MRGGVVALIWLLLTVTATGCPGPGGTGAGAEVKSAGKGTGDGGAAEAKLRTLVDEVVELSRTGGCSGFGARLQAWTSEHRDQVGSLIGELEQSASTELAAELDAYVEERRLLVVETAADCAATSEDAWPAWESFDAMITEARGS